MSIKVYIEWKLNKEDDCVLGAKQTYEGQFTVSSVCYFKLI